MKEIEVQTIVEDCTAQLYYDAIYSTDGGMRAFHSKVNGDANASCDPWSADGVRNVHFVMPMNVPAMLKKFIGLDSVPVVEKQQMEWGTDRTSFKMVSEPLLNFPGANKFTTSGFLEVISQPDGTCLVKALMRCSALMPWPVQATVEGLMATEAASSIGTFLKFCKEYFESWRAEQRQQPERPATPAAPPTAPDGSSGASISDDRFYDAVDDESELARLPSTTGATTEDEASVVPYTPPRLEDVIVGCLRKIEASTAETAATLRALEELIRNMDDNMQVLRDKLVGKRRPPSAGRRAPSAAPSTCRSTTAAAAAAAVPVPSGRGGTWGYLAAASLVCGVGAVAYLRYYRQGSGGSGGASG